jgi:hypothetical protein
MDQTTDHGATRVRRLLREMDGEGGIPAGCGSVRPGVSRTPPSPCDSPPCPHCGSTMTVHQPDLRHPERLLGVCEACASWCLMDLSPDEAEWLIDLLPAGDVRAAWRAGPEISPPATP